MGGIISSLHNQVAGIRSVITLIRGISSEFNNAVLRAAGDPGTPRTSPTASYWLDDPPFPELTNIQSKPLPEQVDIAIIGSGISGVSIARSILHERRRRNVDLDKQVVVFEARELSSGATGRNGGHIKPGSGDLLRLSKFLPEDRAVALTRFQINHIDAITELCKSEGIEIAEAREVDGVDMFLDQASFKKALEAVELYRRLMPEVKINVYRRDVDKGDSSFTGDYPYEGDILKENGGVTKDIVGATMQRAGAIWPYRFVVSLWKKLLEDFPSQLLIETNTPVNSVSSSSSADFPYRLDTGQGTLLARHVVHATNGFTGHLVPGLRSKITGTRGHMSAQRPGDRFPNTLGKRSWLLFYQNGFDYISQRPTQSGDGRIGDLMIGGGIMRSPAAGIDEIGIYDDGVEPDALTVSHISGIFPAIFGPSNWGSGGEVKKVWTGILGMTGDCIPLVGRLDEKLTGRKLSSQQKASKATAVQPGEWVSGGFSGEGMVWAWLCGVGLGTMIVGSENEDIPKVPGRPGGKLKDWFPSEVLVSPKRLRDADISNLALQL